MTAPHPALVTAPWRTAPASVRLLDALEAEARPARFVGGCVRDALADRERAAWDLDLCTAEPPARVMRLLESAGIRSIATGLDHGTVTAVLGEQRFEITTLRRDVATDGRHARVAFTNDFEADAARRDFTINAMSCDRHGRLFDYFGGVHDLEAGVIRFVGDPQERIREDYLRTLRFFRFYAQFGRSQLAGTTRAALQQGVAGLVRLSGERIQKEVLALLATPDPSAAVRLMQALSVWRALLAGEPDVGLFKRLTVLEAEPDPWRRLAILLRTAGTDVGTLTARLKLSNADAARLRALVAVPALEPEVDDAELRRSLYRHGMAASLAAGLFALAAKGRPASAGRAWSARLTVIDAPELPVAGRDVVAAGVAPGPEVGALLERVEAWWLADGACADRATTLAQLRLLLSPPDPDGS